MNFTIGFLELRYVVYMKMDLQLTIYKILLFYLKKKNQLQDIFLHFQMELGLWWTSFAYFSYCIQRKSSN